MMNVPTLHCAQNMYDFLHLHVGVLPRLRLWKKRVLRRGEICENTLFVA